ncbi:MAG: M20/M25/M40 family metallo-hydrolase [Planctomycetota bacterium]|nr:MAG: M20/M25/M40 family metallo-hydrolase [Planctomycetota bacterium]
MFDMKAGLALGVFALEALAALGLVPPLAPVWFVAGDEERGSPGSRRLLVPLARAASRALVLEPALGPEGRLKLVRKGVGRFEITATGRAAHAGLDPAAGANAISELARQIVHLERWAQGVPGLQLNVGRIEGGEAPNVVAAHARAVLDVRAPEPDVAARCQAKLEQLRPHDPRVRLTVRGGFSRPPMPRTARNVALAERAQALAHTLGFALRCGEAGGGSDANLTSPFTPTLDGLGPVGADAHAAGERVHLPSLPERAALLALLLLEPAHTAGP